MISTLFSVFFVFTLVSSSRGPDDANCLPGTWLPEGSDVRMCDSPGYDYDGSLIPDCNAFHGQVNTTSFFHIHEYDCGLYWTCSPEGPCLMQCAACNLNPSDCPDGRLQFDCRYTVPVGPVCDWATTVKCTNCQETCEALNCPGDQTCDPSTDCQCSDCKTDADCSGGEECCDRVCSADCGGEPTTTSAPPSTTTTTPTPATSTTPVPTTTTAPATPDTTTTTTAAQTTTQPATTTTTSCPNDCCSDDDCEEGYMCEDGGCVKKCSSDADCEGSEAICNHPIYDNCEYCDGELCQPGCSDDSNCPVDFAHCTSIHSCTGEPGYPGLVKITVQTYDCTGCNSTAEGGLVVSIDDDSEATQPCTTSGLDNAGKRDYDNGVTAEFLADEDNGMDACQYANVNFNIKSGTATWTGEGTWTGSDSKALCFYFFDKIQDFYPIFNCCDVEEKALTNGMTTGLTNCHQCNDYATC